MLTSWLKNTIVHYINQHRLKERRNAAFELASLAATGEDAKKKIVDHEGYDYEILFDDLLFWHFHNLLYRNFRPLMYVQHKRMSMVFCLHVNVF